MDFIERCFDISPDGGNGLLETLLIALAMLIGAALIRRFFRRAVLVPFVVGMKAKDKVAQRTHHSAPIRSYPGEALVFLSASRMACAPALLPKVSLM